MDFLERFGAALTIEGNTLHVDDRIVPFKREHLRVGVTLREHALRRPTQKKRVRFQEEVQVYVIPSILKIHVLYPS